MKRRYQPKKRLGLTFLLSFSLLAAGFALLAMILPLPPSTERTLLAVTAGILVLLAFTVLCRFGICGYEYYIVDDLFYVVRLVGRRRRVVCDLSTAHIRRCVRVLDGNKPKDVPRPTRCFNFTVSPFPGECAYLYYGTRDDRLHLLILNYHKDFFDDLTSVLYKTT